MRARIKMTAVQEYSIKPKYYSQGSTYKEMMEADITSFRDDHELFLDRADSINFTGELIPEPGDKVYDEPK